MPAEIPKALKTDSGHLIYFSLEDNKLQENKLNFGSHSVRTIGSSMGLCDSADLFCARKSAEAFKQIIKSDSQNQELQNLPKNQHDYIAWASSALPNPSDNSTKKTDSIFERMVTFIHTSLDSTKTAKPSLTLTHKNRFMGRIGGKTSLETL